MYPSYELLSHVPTQSLFYTKIGMLHTFSTFSVNGCGPATPHRLTEYANKIVKNTQIKFLPKMEVALPRPSGLPNTPTSLKTILKILLIISNRC